MEEQVKIFLLCSPHNPVGRVWQMEELRQMLDICRAHGVYVIADEIHHDFIYGENRHIPAATVGAYDDMLVTLTSPSKTFNLAGLKNSVIIISDPRLRCAYDDYTKKLHVDTGNSVGFVAAEAAYDGGRPWLESVLQTVWGNYEILRNELLPQKPGVILSPLEGTYLAWLDVHAYIKPEEMESRIEGAMRACHGLRELVWRQRAVSCSHESGHQTGKHSLCGTDAGKISVKQTRATSF